MPEYRLRLRKKYKVFKEPERSIREPGIGMSVDKVLFYARTIPTLRFRLTNGETYPERLYTTPHQKNIRTIPEVQPRAYVRARNSGDALSKSGKKTIETLKQIKTDSYMTQKKMIPGL